MAPNPIDMDTVFKELSRLDETGNVGVLLTIIFVFLLYVIAIILAKRADRRDQAKVGDKKLEKYPRVSLLSCWILLMSHFLNPHRIQLDKVKNT